MIEKVDQREIRQQSYSGVVDSYGRWPGVSCQKRLRETMVQVNVAERAFECCLQKTDSAVSNVCDIRHTMMLHTSRGAKT